MDQLKITKKNETFLFIETDPGIEMELTEHFCFFVPGYKFMPAYRNKFWDGKIRLFDTRKKTLYVGLYTVAPSDTGGGTEVSGGAYARQTATFTV